MLWEATREATPTLLACAAGAFVLTCVLVRQDDAAMTQSRVMRIAALVLARSRSASGSTSTASRPSGCGAW